ncbi:hypothetical protein GCM10022381_25210 [Leifsonia kafniensis]|uniref:AbiEi antitoxin N-terminal domain-containing protein n=1 Tax=Leifsonia kafniensis TaxID=475957 RepID=A0ABP7KMA4_9MICO
MQRTQARAITTDGSIADAALAVLAARYDGLIPSKALGEAGINAHAAKSLVARGLLVRIRRGMYVQPELWNDVRAEGRYQLVVRSTMALTRRPAIVSHLSAAVIHDLPIVGSWPKTVHTLEPDAAGGSSSRFVTSHRSGATPAPVRNGELLVTSLARTVIDVAASSSFLNGVTVADHALRVEGERAAAEVKRGAVGTPALTKADLYAELARVNPRYGFRQAERVIAFANPLSANLGESLSRVRIFELGFQVPELQVHFVVGNGHNCWVDCYWRGIRKIGEFDGKHKYTRGIVLGDRDPAEVMVAEKVREDALRAHPDCDSFDRWDWDTAISPRLFSRFLSEHGMPLA